MFRELAETVIEVLEIISKIPRKMDEIPKCRKRVHVVVVFREKREREVKGTGWESTQFLEKVEQIIFA